MAIDIMKHDFVCHGGHNKLYKRRILNENNIF